MAQAKLGANVFDDEEDEGLEDEFNVEIVTDVSEDFTDHANAFGDFDKRIIQDILNAASANFKFKPQKWSDLLMRLQIVIDDYKAADEETDEDDLRSELQGLLSEARDLTVH